MRRPPDLRDLVDELGPDDEARLRRVHELLVAAGPPPELPAALEQPPAERTPAPAVRAISRRGFSFALAGATVLAAAAFAGGYVVGDRGPAQERVVAMHGTAAAPRAEASIEVLEQDEVGNWPLVVRVRGLPQQPREGYYNLYLSRDGEPIVLCGSFRVRDGTTVVRMNAPYQLKEWGWVVTEQPPGKHDPGRVVLTT